MGSGLDGLSPSLGAEDVFLVSGLSILGPVWWCLGGSLSGGPVSRYRLSSLEGKVHSYIRMIPKERLAQLYNTSG